MSNKLAIQSNYQLCVLISKNLGRNTFTFTFAVPPSITEITGKTVTEGENVTLNCSAKGTPDPNTTWTRLSDNSVVTMPLININRHDVRDYRCTADNGIGTPASREVSIDVQCKCYVELFILVKSMISLLSSL